MEKEIVIPEGTPKALIAICATIVATSAIKAIFLYKTKQLDVGN